MSNSAANLVIKAEGLGKRYLMPHKESRSGKDRLRAHLKEFLPFAGRSDEDYFWALRDLDFEVREGDILGIVGKNGSGKSTLLKILSRVTQPSAGRVSLRGRVGSLLEVGTGFHPDLTGRENVFMSGALLGLKQNEIKAKFDEIVDFSGIENFIDVPVKRYSSGMYVRLAYSVASLLRSDILILDEVMAVGDAAFKEKSQNNIEKLSREGCTILFVSHNARAITSICKTGMILEAGRCIFRGEVKEAVATYMRSVQGIDQNDAEKKKDKSFFDLRDEPRLVDGQRVFEWVSLHAADGTPTHAFSTGQPLVVRIGYSGAKARTPYFTVLIHNEFAERVATIHSTHDPKAAFPEQGVIECRVDQVNLGEGSYRIMLDYGNSGGVRGTLTSLDCISSAARIKVQLNAYLAGVGLDAYQGAVHRSQWTVLHQDPARA